MEKRKMKNKKMKQKRYLISFGAQKDLIEKYCFGKCGKICLGAVRFEGGEFGYCCEDNCPFCKKSINMGVCSVDGLNEKFEIIVRKLEEKQK